MGSRKSPVFPSVSNLQPHFTFRDFSQGAIRSPRIYTFPNTLLSRHPQFFMVPYSNHNEPSSLLGGLHMCLWKSRALGAREMAQKVKCSSSHSQVRHCTPVPQYWDAGGRQLNPWSSYWLARQLDQRDPGSSGELVSKNKRRWMENDT